MLDESIDGRSSHTLMSTTPSSPREPSELSSASPAAARTRPTRFSTASVCTHAEQSGSGHRTAELQLPLRLSRRHQSSAREQHKTHCTVLYCTVHACLCEQCLHRQVACHVLQRVGASAGASNQIEYSTVNYSIILVRVAPGSESAAIWVMRLAFWRVNT